MKTIRYELADGIATLTFDEPGSPVNTMCLQWQDDLSEAVQQVLQDQGTDPRHRAGSAKSTFFAGADLKARDAPHSADARRVPRVERVKKNFRTLETLGKPVVSCLNGTALGGGWEVALVGHYRVAVDDRKIQFGLPEVTLGLIPGASGVTKMTRLLGLMGAQPYILEASCSTRARRWNWAWCMNWCRCARLRAAAWPGSPPTPRRSSPGTRRTTKCPAARRATPRSRGPGGRAGHAEAEDARPLSRARSHPGRMVEGAQVDFDTALRIESRYLAKG
jgi:3-hydroxyacyl-CoA dehydrogenase/enoyl-CoA hydratase/3-hydroxybutyryl-CoA epimerase